MTPRTLAVVSAGLGQPSSTRLLADRLTAAIREAAGEWGLELAVTVVELREYAHDVTNNLLAGFPSTSLRRVVDAVTAADALVAVTPVFSASYSGLFKSFFDVLDPDALAGKPVLVGATGGTARHSLALEYALRPLFAHLRAVVVPTAVFAASEDWAGADPGGPRSDVGSALDARIRRAGRELAEEMARREPASPADPFALTTDFAQLLSGQ